MRAEMPSRAEIEKALGAKSGELAYIPTRHYDDDLHVLVNLAEAWLAALDGPTVTIEWVGLGDGNAPGPGTFVLVKKEDR